MTKRDILQFIFKWRSLITRLFLFIVLLVTLLQYLSPQSYPAQATVLIERNRAPVMRSDYVPGLDMVEAQTTEGEIILSRTVMEQAVDVVKPHQRPSKTNAVKEAVKNVKQFMVDIGLSEQVGKRDKWIAHLQKNVKTKAVVNSSIIHIMYADEVPQWSSEIVNAITDAYLEHHLKVFSPNDTAFLKKQLDDAEIELSSLRAELADYKNDEDVSALLQSQAELVNLIGSIQEKEANDRAMLASLSQKYQAGHSKIKSLNAKLEQYTDSLNSIHSRLQKLEVSEAKIEQIESNIELQRRFVNDYKQRYVQAKLSESANTDVVNVRVVEYASPAPKPKHSRLFYIVLGIIGGLLMSFGCALVFEYFDRRVQDPRDAELLLGIPELGSIPKI